MVGTAIKVFLPCPVVLERDQLVKISFAINHCLLIDFHSAAKSIQLFDAFFYI